MPPPYRSGLYAHKGEEFTELEQGMKNKGFSIVEATVSAIIFVIATAGVLSMISATRQSASVSEEETGAVYYGQQILEELRASVDQTSWDTGGLTVGSHTLSFGLYTATYSVTDVPGGNGVRKVTLDIVWNEP